MQDNPVVVNGTVIYTSVSGDVIIPDGVTTIGTDAFWSCDTITSVIIPDSVTNIGDCADTSETAAITSAETTSASAVSSNTGGSLPQTGNNSLASLIKVSGATLLTFAGIFAIAKSDITGRRKKEKE